MPQARSSGSGSGSSPGGSSGSGQTKRSTGGRSAGSRATGSRATGSRATGSRSTAAKRTTKSVAAAAQARGRPARVPPVLPPARRSPLSPRIPVLRRWRSASASSRADHRGEQGCGRDDAFQLREGTEGDCGLDRARTGQQRYRVGLDTRHDPGQVHPRRDQRLDVGRARNAQVVR